MTNWLPYWLSPRDVDLVEIAKGDRPDTEFVVSCDRWPMADQLGALAYDGGVDYIYRLWVLPGPFQEELKAQGRLLTPAELDALHGE